MPRRPNTTPQTRDLLRLFLERPGDWQYGYEISKATGLKSGTLYPMLLRLTEQRLLEKRSAESPEPGRPPRKLYRLSVSGIAVARVARSQADTAQAS